MLARRLRSRTACALGGLSATLALSTAGCAPEPGGARFEVRARWAAADAHELFSPEALLEPVAETATAPARPCRLVPDETRSDLEEIDCAAVPGTGPIDLELVVRGSNLAPLRFFEPRATAPRAVASAATADGIEATYRLRLDPRPPAAGGDRWRFRLVGASAGALASPELTVVPLGRGERAEVTAVARAWKFDFGHEWRTGALALPAHPLRWRVAAPGPGARLETALASTGSPLRYRILDEAADGDRVLLAGELAATGSWTPLAIDLPAARKDGIELRFEVEGTEPEAWGAWAEPLVLAPRTGPPRPDLVLIVLDTVRADRLTPYGGAPELTPFLAEMARERARLYERAVTPATWTFPAHVSLMTGLEAFRHGAFTEDDAGVLPALPTLAGLLRAEGYRTLAVTADGFVHPRFGFASGFDRYAYFDYQADADGELAHDVDRTLAALAEVSDQPLFLFFHTYEAHVPNRWRRPPPPGADATRSRLEVQGYEGRPGPEIGFYGTPGFSIRDLDSGAERPAIAADAPLLIGLYDQALEHLDRELRRLADGLERANRWRDALVVVTSDHGESLGEHGRMSHNLLDEANLRVPLLIGWPGGSGAGERDASLVSLVDLMPTLLATAGVSPPPRLDGRALRPRSEHGERPRELAWSYAVVNNRGLALSLPDARKLVLLDSAWRGLPPRERWFDPVRDPAEDTPLTAVGAGEARLAASAWRALAEGLPGLRIRATNGSPHTVELLLRHPAIQPSGVKLPVAGPELSWVRAARASARLAPGEQGAWILTGARADRIDLEGEVSTLPATSPPLALAVHAPSPGPGRVLRLAADLGTGRWRSGAAAPGELGLELEWRGVARRTADASSPLADAELRRGLGALGYLQ